MGACVQTVAGLLLFLLFYYKLFELKFILCELLNKQKRYCRFPFRIAFFFAFPISDFSKESQMKKGVISNFFEVFDENVLYNDVQQLLHKQKEIPKAQELQEKKRLLNYYELY